MKKSSRIANHLILITLLLFIVSSCKKDDTITVTDKDGNVYSAVPIGNQIWMTENLRTTKFCDSTKITLITNNSTWSTTTIAAYCWYNNDVANKDLYGAIYNWYAVGTKKLCPVGWHVPSHAEFKILEMNLGMTQKSADSTGWRGTDQGRRMKSKTGWKSGGNGTNSSGFSGLPGGYRWAQTGEFFNLGELSYWWTSTEGNSLGYYRRLDYNQIKVYAEGVKKTGGKYVRCIKDAI